MARDETTRLDRALQERMYFISHIPPTASNRAHNVLVTGQSGKLYTVTLPTTRSALAQCNCMDQRIRRTLCKHLLFTLLRVLKLPRDRLPHTGRQVIPMLSTTLLPAIEAAAANIRCRDVEAPDQVTNVVRAIAPGVLGVRKAVDRKKVSSEDECAICCEEFGTMGLVFCDFGCGNAVHEECFKKYEEAVNGPVRCVYCRAVWRSEGVEHIGKRGLLVGRRIVNVADVVPAAFEHGNGGVRHLGLDKNVKTGSGSGSGSGRRRKNKVEVKEVKQRITKKGPSEREMRARARELRRRQAETKGKGKGNGIGARTRSRTSTGV